MFLPLSSFFLWSSCMAALAAPPARLVPSSLPPASLAKTRVPPSISSQAASPAINSNVVNCAPYGPKGSPGGGGALGSCLNICWYLNCFKGANQFTCDPAGAAQRRVASGCGRHPCTGSYATKQPFQTFIANGGTGGQYLPSGSAQCDEFPPALFAQGGRNARPRCIDGSDNGRSGNYYKAMCKAYGTSAFSISLTNQGAFPPCQPNPNCNNSPPGQFFLKSPYTTTDYTPGKRDVAGDYEYHALATELHYGAMELPSFIAHNITRRNYLMSDGSTILLITHDPDHDYAVGSRHIKEDESIITVVRKL